MYRWGVDLAVPFPVTVHSNTHVFIAIDHYTKHIKVWGLLAKEAPYIAAAFLEMVLARFGARAEVPRGQRWRVPAAEFHDLHNRCLIDHRQTSPGYPQTNGLAEWIVQTFKRSLRKVIKQTRRPMQRDEQLYWITLAERCSRR